MLDDLVLLRVLVRPKTGLTPDVLAKDVVALAGGTAEDVARAVARLEQSEHVQHGTLALTARGERRALDFLGLSAKPAGLDWPRAQSRLSAKLLGLPGRKLEPERLLAKYLAREHQLRVPEVPSISQSLNALVWKQLGFDDAAPKIPNAIRQRVLGRMVGMPLRSKDAALGRVVANKGSGSSTWQQALIRRALEAPTFAGHVRALARAHVEPSLGTLALIATVWRAYAVEPGNAAVTLSDFKARLREAHRAGQLQLSRADFVYELDAELVRESEIQQDGATWHLIRAED